MKFSLIKTLTNTQWLQSMSGPPSTYFYFQLEGYCQIHTVKHQYADILRRRNTDLIRIIHTGWQLCHLCSFAS